MKHGILKKNENTIDIFKRSFDIIILIISGFLAYFFTYNTVSIAPLSLISLITCIILSIIIFNSFPLYKAWRGMKLFAELRIIIYAWSLSFILNLLIVFLFLKSSFHDNALKEWFTTWFLFCMLSLLVFRFFLKISLAFLRKSGFNQRHICIVSYGPSAEDIYKNICNNSSYGFTVEAVFSNIKKFKCKTLNKLLKGKIKHISDWLDDNAIDQIWITAPMEKMKIAKKIMHDMRHRTVDIRFFPDLNSYNLLNHSVSELGNIPCFNLSISPMASTINKIIKRLEDIILGICILILFLPVMFLIALIIKLTSDGPVIYKQKRIGYNNNTFLINKFRTMPTDIEKDTGAVWARKNENRTTTFGKFLRKTSLDELPQLFNVLKGEMSLVGPRPERPEFVEKFKNEIPFYMKKHMVKAGITGWAQINGYRGNTSLKKRIEYDIYYIKNWSLLFDLKIITVTIFKGFISKNAY